MYEVHPDDRGQWVLYRADGADLLVIAWFTERQDAEFAREAFEKRAALRPQPASPNDAAPGYVTPARA